MRVLVVEDDPRVREVVRSSLTSAGHSLSVAASIAAANTEIAARAPDLAVVDVGLPDGSGLDLCRSLRASGYEFPLLLLTARTGVDDRVLGLDAGADDYLGKPFSTAELCARVRALTRRGARWTESKRTFGSLTIDRDRRVVNIGSESVPLTSREFDIVALLAWRDGRVIPKDELVESIWGEVEDGAIASLEVLMTRIRRKLGSCGDVVRTVRQVGYAWALERSKSP